MPADPKLVRELFLAAAELPATDRAAYLTAHDGGDAELRAAVERLLAAHEQPASVLARSAPGMPTDDYAPIAERVGTRIGPYKLMEQIGEGGFGLVFVAEQTEPVRRKVALKVIKPGMDSKQVIARFEAERQALAMMDHPNIARVLDAGATDSGRPYFVMELVRGIPITAYCDQNHLTPTERLELFVSVCHAIQHAHQKGVIHRDVKPSNVLVTSHDGKPVAKVIDFGVAKAIHQHLTDRTIYTNFAQMIGTPLYMSPEQAEMSGLDIDTRSDIYSLGVLLYELLTGSTPLAKKRVATAAYDEIRRLIREEEPPKPSTRLSSSDSLASIAAQRHTEPAKLSKLVRGDLDWITMKALEKDRTRRYETANGLARDIQRYLSDEPVEACPPSATYRLRKFARKNRAALTTAAVIGVLLVAGVAISTWQAVRATRAEADARAAQHAEAERAAGERRANAELAARNGELADAQAKVQVRFELAQKAIATFHTGVSEDALLNNAEFKELRTKLLKEAAGFYAELEKLLAGQTDFRSRQALAAAYSQLGELTEKIGDPKEAVMVQRKALALRRNLASTNGADVETRLDVARSLLIVGRLLYATFDFAGALAADEEARNLAAALEAESPTDAVRAALAQAHLNIGLELAATHKGAEALKEHHKALAIRQKLADANQTVTLFQSDLAGSHNNIGNVLWGTGKPPEALKEYQKALAIRQKLADANPAITQFQRDLAASHNNIGLVLSDTGNPAEGLQEHQKALAIRQKLADANPAVTQFQRDLAWSHSHVASCLFRMEKRAEALKECQQELAIRQKLADASPAVTQFQSDLALSHGNIGAFLHEMGKPAEALKEFQQELAIQQNVADANPAVTEFQRALANAHNQIGWVLWLTGKPEEAMAAYRKVLVIYQKLADANPAVTVFQSRLARSHSTIGNVLLQTGKAPEALKAFEKAYAILQQPADAKPAVADLQSQLAQYHDATGWVLSRTGKPKVAMAEHQEALSLYKKLADANPTDALYQEGLAWAHNRLGRLLARQQRFACAFTALDAGMAIFQKLAGTHPKSAHHTNLLGYSHAYRGWALVRFGQPSKAAADLRRAVELWAKVPGPDPEDQFERSRALALLAGLGGVAKSGVTTAEAARFADQAVSSLRDAFSAGWGWPDELKEPDFDPLRKREDFKKLLAEVEAKARPKALE
jgi:serine/threonine protein kinase/tetratricopeptide (TPR) repeat protein